MLLTLIKKTQDMQYDKSSAFRTTLSTIVDDVTKEKSKLKTIVKELASHPIKMIMTFLTAPFLVLWLGLTLKNPIRRFIAIIGLMVSVICSYVAGTLLGTFTGALFVMSNIGFFVGFGFIVGSFFSVLFSVVFSILVFNAVSFLFLKMSSQEVVDYLDKISSEK